jgi:hypothetical protein
MYVGYVLEQAFPTSMCIRATCYIDRYFAGHIHKGAGRIQDFLGGMGGRCSIFGETSPEIPVLEITQRIKNKIM